MRFFLWNIWVLASAPGLALIATGAPPSTRDALVSADEALPSASRVDDLLALIEGQNAPNVRRTGVRELLRLEWPDTVQRLTAILCGQNRAAKNATALGLSDLPRWLRPEYIEPLLAMLSDPDAETRDAASRALAAYMDASVVEGLRKIALDRAASIVARQAALDTLGKLPQRQAAAALIDALGDGDPEFRMRALEALSAATATDFQGSVSTALSWWSEMATMDDSHWQSLQLARFAQSNRLGNERLRELESRLSKALRDAYLLTPEADRGATLNAYLDDANSRVRTLGLELAQGLLADGKSLTPTTVERLRRLLTAPEPELRAAAVRTVASLRDASDGARFREMLAGERVQKVRLALLNGLGYVGDTSVASALLDALTSEPSPACDEAVAALGRLAERGALDPPTRERVCQALESRAVAVRDQPAALERTLWAMSRMNDQRFATAFLEALSRAEAPTVQLAGLRGLAALLDVRGATANPATRPVNPGPAATTTAWADAIAPLLGCADVDIRRTSAETLGRLSCDPKHLEALWSRLDATAEPDDGVRASVWKSVLAYFASRPLEECLGAIDRLPENDARPLRVLDLLQLAERATATGGLDLRTDIRLRAARLMGELKRDAEAEAVYRRCLDDLKAGDASRLYDVAAEFICFAIQRERYKRETIGDAALTGIFGEPSFWEATRARCENMIKDNQVDAAVEVLTRLVFEPPSALPDAAIDEALRNLLVRAREAQIEADRLRVQSALQRLESDPNDQDAVKVIQGLGERAAPALREELRALLMTDAPDGARERRLHDLLRDCSQGWEGFNLDAPREEKLRRLGLALAARRIADH